MGIGVEGAEDEYVAHLLGEVSICGNVEDGRTGYGDVGASKRPV